MPLEKAYWELVRIQDSVWHFDCQGCSTRCHTSARMKTRHSGLHATTTNSANVWMIEGAPPWHVLPDVKHEQGRLSPLFRERSKANCWGFQPVSSVVQMKSPIADMKNTGVRYGGAITAALFLRQFVDTDKARPARPAKLHTAAAC